jgi:hypothetical protein
VFATDIPIHPIMIFVDKARSLPFVGSPVRAPALPENIRLRRCLAMSNTLAYYDTETMTVLISFIILDAAVKDKKCLQD